ncbi:hypothetical protein HZA40_04325 [Candidatus Peregrinibacteria bacterium]|nr:hypothetical protein [Candidatus Peregrinibacteria bacterium]
MTHFHQEDNEIRNLKRRAKGGSLSRAEFSQSPIARRPPPFGRREEECMGAPACVAPFQRTLAQVGVGFSKNLWRLASRCFKMSPNLVIEAAPPSKSRFFGHGGPRKTQFHGGFLADDVEVRRAERGIKPNGKINKIPFGSIANFLFFAEGKTSKFPLKKSDNFPCEARLCPKAITN